MLYKQLKRDLRHGRLYCSTCEAAALSALIVQEELGDYNPDLHRENYISSMMLTLRQNSVLENKIMELHKKREPFQNEITPINEFLHIARGLETYGIDPHPVKDHRGTQLYIGVNYFGISAFISGKRSQHFKWSEIQKINFEGKMFIAHLYYPDSNREVKKHTVGYKCTSNTTCRCLWRYAVEQMLFFTLPHNQNAAVISGGGFFTRGAKFKYTGRTEREIIAETINTLTARRTAGSSNKRKASSVPATPSSPQGGLTQLRYSSLPRSVMPDPRRKCSNEQSNLSFGISHYMQDESKCDDVHNPYLDEAAETPQHPRILSNKSWENIHFSNRNSTIIASHSSADSLSSNSCIAGINEIQHINHDAIACPSNLMENNTYMKDICTTMNKRAYRHAKSSHKFNFLNVFVPSFILVLALLILTIIIILESNFENFSRIRDWPEIISFQYQYYQPLKNFLRKQIGFK